MMTALNLYDRVFVKAGFFDGSEHEDPENYSNGLVDGRDHKLYGFIIDWTLTDSVVVFFEKDKDVHVVDYSEVSKDKSKKPVTEKNIKAAIKIYDTWKANRVTRQTHTPKQTNKRNTGGLLSSNKKRLKTVEKGKGKGKVKEIGESLDKNKDVDQESEDQESEDQDDVEKIVALVKKIRKDTSVKQNSKNKYLLLLNNQQEMIDNLLVLINDLKSSCENMKEEIENS